MIQSSRIDHTSTWRSVPNRYILEYDGTSASSTGTKLIAVADLDSVLEGSYEKIGYRISSSETITDFAGDGSALNALATSRLNAAASYTDTWSISTLYIPIREGDIVLFVKEKETITCLVKSITLDVFARTMQVTLRGLG